MENIDEKLEMARHSMAHVLAKALVKTYPSLKLTIGPPVENGFYYDIDLAESIKPEDYKKIENEMKAIINRGEEFKKEIVSKTKALELFKGNQYKEELIRELADGEEISIYYLGEDFFDLCRGPHVESTKNLQSYGYKIDKVTGAYWRGNEKNKMLQRVYVFAFKTSKELAEYLNMLEEAKKRDHRKLGRELDLFMTLPESPGSAFFLPKGMVLRNQLEAYWREIHDREGYVEIKTPIILKRTLWEVSGHWDKYREDMFTTAADEEAYALKPMNCPGGLLVYNSKPRSYKDLPLRMGELGLVHRYEKSGELNGLLRVRSFTQDDAHIYIAKDQITDEIIRIINMIDEVYSVFGFSYRVELSTMPEKHIGTEGEWNEAISALKIALDKRGLEYKINEGDGAFYGPKIDFKLKDSIGRTWQCGTIQLDFQLPGRFGSEYTGADGEKHTPIMIHRVLYGSIDRFIGVITEHFAGAFPLWLAPVQVKVLSLTDRNEDYAGRIFKELKESGIRAELDNRNEKIGYKIREALSEKVPYQIIVGDEEESKNQISVRGRGNENVGGLNLGDFVARLKQEIKDKKR